MAFVQNLRRWRCTLGPVRYRLEVRLDAGDVGRRVVIRWRRPAAHGEEIADVLGVLEAADAGSFSVRKASGELVTIPRDRALAGKTVPAAPRRGRREQGRAGESLRLGRGIGGWRQPGDAQAGLNERIQPLGADRSPHPGQRPPHQP